MPAAFSLVCAYFIIAGGACKEVRHTCEFLGADKLATKGGGGLYHTWKDCISPSLFQKNKKKKQKPTCHKVKWLGQLNIQQKRKS